MTELIEKAWVVLWGVLLVLMFIGLAISGEIVI